MRRERASGTFQTRNYPWSAGCAFPCYRAKINFILWGIRRTCRIGIRSHRFGCFCQPLTNSILCLRSDFREAQTSELFRVIHPSNFSGELEPLRGIGRNRQTNWAGLTHRIRGMKSETLFGGVQHDSPALRLELDIRELFRCLSLQTPPFKVHLFQEPLDTVHARASSTDRKSTRLNSSHSQISYAVFCLKKKKTPTALYYTCLILTTPESRSSWTLGISYSLSTRREESYL